MIVASKVAWLFIQLFDMFLYFFFFFNVTATTEIYTLSLHDALPISCRDSRHRGAPRRPRPGRAPRKRSEEHTSELQSRVDLVCRLLLEKKKLEQPDASATNLTATLGLRIGRYFFHVAAPLPKRVRLG